MKMIAGLRVPKCVAWKLYLKWGIKIFRFNPEKRKLSSQKALAVKSIFWLPWRLMRLCDCPFRFFFSPFSFLFLGPFIYSRSLALVTPPSRVLYNDHVKDTQAWFLWVIIMWSLLVLYCLRSLKKQNHEFHIRLMYNQEKIRRFSLGIIKTFIRFGFLYPE